MDTPVVDAEGTIQVRVEVVNSGERAGEEVVQLYAQMQCRGVTRPVRELVGFDRVPLDAGDTATVTFSLQPALLAYYDVEMELVVTPGEVQLMTGSTSARLPLTTTFTIAGDPVTLTSRAVHPTASSIAYS